MKIELKIVPEDYDSSYSITWKDTIGQSKGYKLNTRPFEIWCILKNKKDTIGYYKGLSTPSDFTYFSTKDTFITATFMIAPNFFSDILSDAERKRISEGKEKIIKFELVRLNIKNDLRKTLEFVLTEK